MKLKANMKIKQIKRCPEVWRSSSFVQRGNGDNHINVISPKWYDMVYDRNDEIYEWSNIV